MTATAASLEAEALTLPEGDRLDLLQRLLRGFYSGKVGTESQVARLWASEASARDRQMETGEDPGIDADELFARLRSPAQ